MLVMIVVLLTGKIAFAASDGMTDLKLIAVGITTDKIASRSLFLTPLHIVLPWLLESSGDYSYFYYAIWMAAYYMQQIASYCIFLSMMAFNAQISDPKIGGTYMTLLNTLNNLGGNWPVTLFLSITDFFNRKNCVATGTKLILGACNTKKMKKCVLKVVMFVNFILMVIIFCWNIRIKYFQKIPRQEWRVIKNK
uniref:Uncharacterized protein n=1 Tax=Meloidogyne enterolobii TaxID=390850 RepID=A0A6V7VB36_MELEN|nr:unnamed protein product [Meloidogyne enterolobii]